MERTIFSRIIFIERGVIQVRKKGLFIFVLVMALIANVFCSCGTANAGNNSGAETPATTTVNAEAEPQISGEASTGPEAELAGHQVVAEDPDGNNDIGGDYGLGDPDADDEDNQTGVPEEPEEEVPAPGGHDGYRYEVGDTVVYTDNPIDRWVTYDEEYNLYNFDVVRMLFDLWCQDGGNIIEGNDAPTIYDHDGKPYQYSDICSFYDKNGDFAGWVYFSTPDEEYAYVFHSFTVTRIVDGKHYSTSVTMHDSDYNFHDDYKCVLDGYIRGIHNDIAVLLLATAEKVAKSPEQANVLSGLALGSNYSIDDSDLQLEMILTR